MENLNKDFTLVGSKGSDSTEKIAKPALSFFQDAWRRFKKNKVALVAMWIIAITLVFSVISAFVVPQSKANYFDPNKSQVYGNLPPKLSGDLPFWNGEFKEQMSINHKMFQAKTNISSGLINMVVH